MYPLTRFLCGWVVLFQPVAQAIWNPIISGWNPDPAILTVGDDYYIATSSFEYWPGIPIYHSKFPNHSFIEPVLLIDSKARTYPIGRSSLML